MTDGRTDRKEVFMNRLVFTYLILLSGHLSAAPMYGLSAGTDGCYGQNGVKLTDGGAPIQVYLQSDFAQKYAAHLNASGSSPLTQTQIAVVLQNAMEVWNRESRGPLFVYAGERSINAEAGVVEGAGGLPRALVEVSCQELQATLPERALFVAYTIADHAAGSTCGASSPCQMNGDVPNRIFSTFPASFATSRNASGTYNATACMIDANNFVRNAILRISGGRSTFHNLKALFVHELGHALGLRDAASANGSPAPMSVMAPASAYFDTVGRVLADRAAAATQSFSNDINAGGPALYTESAPYPEGVGYVVGSTPNYLLADHGIAPEEQSNRLRVERLHQIHLWPYDVDCVDDDLDDNRGFVLEDARRRSLAYWSEEYAPSTNTFRAVEGTSGDITSKGFISGGRITLPSNAPTYGLYHDDPDGTNDGTGELIRAALGLNGNGSIPYSQSHDISNVHLKNLSFAPTLTTVLERVATSPSFRTVLLFARSERANITGFADRNNIVVTLDPPVLRQQRGANIGGADAIEDLFACSGTTSCNERRLQSHIPISTAFDPSSNLTIFATVPTRGNCYTDDRVLGSAPAEGLTCGRVYLHAGYASNASANSRTLRRGQMVVPQSFPAYSMPAHSFSNPVLHNYIGRTDSGVGLACAPPSEVAELPGSANCIVAWVDSGVPDGHVLAAFFSVSNNSVNIESSAVRLASAGGPVTSVSDLSVAYFADRFWLAWKSAEPNAAAAAPARMSTSATNANVWGENLFKFVNFTAADAPVWLYDPQDGQQEAAFVFSAPN